jgi:hypothetical protein
MLKPTDKASYGWHKKNQGVSIPVIELIAAIKDLFPLRLTAMQTRAGYPLLLDGLDAAGNKPCLVRNSIIKRSNSQGCSI